MAARKKNKNKSFGEKIKEKGKGGREEWEKRLKNASLRFKNSKKKIPSRQR